MSICWYQDKELEINFDDLPKLSIRYVKPDDLQNIVNEINNKPFVNLSNLNVILVDKIKEKVYEFLIKENYIWDGATIPRVFWRLIGSKTDNKFLIPSLIHDFMCENHKCIDCDRYFSTIVFERLLYVSGVSPINRWMMKHSVDNFQKIFGNWRG